MYRFQKIFLAVCLLFCSWQASAAAAPVPVSDMSIYQFTKAVDQLAAQEEIQTYFSDYQHLTPYEKDGPLDVYALEYNDGAHRAVILYATRDASCIERITILWPPGDEISMENAADLGDLMGIVIGLTEEESDEMTSQGNGANVWCKAANRRICAEIVQTSAAQGFVLTAEDR